MKTRTLKGWGAASPNAAAFLDIAEIELSALNSQ